MTYIVVRGSRSACGLHPGSVTWRECPHCARAAALTDAALATVKPTPPKQPGKPLTDKARAYVVYEPLRARKARNAIVPNRESRP